MRFPFYLRRLESNEVLITSSWLRAVWTMASTMSLSLLLVFVLFAGGGVRGEGRIYGGSDAAIEDFPYQLSLEYESQPACGAAVLSVDWALTTVSCVGYLPVENVTIRAGSSDPYSGGTVHQAVEIVNHVNFSIWRYVEFDYNVAVVRVTPPFTLGVGVQPAVLASEGYNPTAGAKVTVSGYGSLSDGSLPRVLQQVQVTVVAMEDCRRNLGDIGRLTERMFCAGDDFKDFCGGDGGAPLVEGGVLVGLASWGYGCGMPGYPGVYSSVGKLRSWITDITGV